MDFDRDRFRSGLFISKCILKLYFWKFYTCNYYKKNRVKSANLFLVGTGNFSVRHTFQRPATFKSNNNKHCSNHNWLHSSSLMYSIILRLNQCCVTNGTEYKASSVWHLLTTLTGSEGAFFFLIEKRDLFVRATLSQWPSGRGGAWLMPTLSGIFTLYVVVKSVVWEQPVGHGGVRWERGACRLHHPGSELQRLPPTPQVGPSYFRFVI